MVPWASGGERKVRGSFPLSSSVYSFGAPWDKACLKDSTLFFRALYCQVTFSGDQASDEEKIRKLPLMRSRSDRHFLLRLRHL